MRITAIVPSAGRSQRMNPVRNKISNGVKSSLEKPYLLLGDKPILAHTLLALDRSPLVHEIILLVRRSRLAVAKKLIRTFRIRKVIGIYTGGKNRFLSVWEGLKRVPAGSDFVLVHDGARPLLKAALIRKVVLAAKRHGAAVPALPVRATVKRGEGRFVRETLLRKELWEIQTPQVFRRALLLRGYARARKENIMTTDCAAVVERLRKKVYLVPGDPQNIKITTREELALAEIFMRKRI